MEVKIGQLWWIYSRTNCKIKNALICHKKIHPPPPLRHWHYSVLLHSEAIRVLLRLILHSCGTLKCVSTFTIPSSVTYSFILCFYSFLLDANKFYSMVIYRSINEIFSNVRWIECQFQNSLSSLTSGQPLVVTDRLKKQEHKQNF